MIGPALSAGAYRAARAYLNWSTPKLARMAGVAVKTVFDAERGRRVPAVDLARIEQAFRDEAGSDMIVVDEHYGWVLFEEDRRFYLDVLCSHSAVDYLFLLRLSDDEIALWRDRGTDYLDDLAYRIHYSAPGVQGSRSPYKPRSLVMTPERERATEAVTKHRSGSQPRS